MEKFLFRNATWLVVALGAIMPGRAEGLKVAAVRYVPDVAFPQYVHLWSENWGVQGEDGEPRTYAAKSMPLGAYVHLVVRNEGTEPATISDVKLEGVSLKEAIAFSKQKAARREPASIRFSKLPPDQIEKLIALGEPVWWKMDPVKVAPGGFAEVVVRLRRPMTNAATAEVVSDRGAAVSPVGQQEVARIESVSFDPALNRLYAYMRPPASGSGAPKVFFDGEDMTATAKVLSDRGTDVWPVLVPLAKPLEKGSQHFVQLSFEGGATASAAVRAFADEFVYGMWGYVNQGDTPEARVDFYLGDLKRHNVNTVMHSYGGEVGKYLAGTNGVEHAKQTGVRAMRPGPGNDLNPVYYFLMDEPDAHDYAVNQLPLPQRLGTLGQDVVRTSVEFRAADAKTPQLLNLDNTYKPENWYTYAQLPDVCCADPYFQEQQRIVWTRKPAWAASFVKPWYVLGVATICNWACAPKPLHIILNSVCHGSGPDGFRYATPEEKTVELFYALGAGTKSFSYWWYTPSGEFKGCGAPEKEAVALWRQIGLLGAQVRTAGPILTRSCPATVPVKAPAKLWTRTLLSGADTIVLLAVNEGIASDRLGTVVVPLEKAPVTVTAPEWLKAKEVFEITPEGVRDANAKVSGQEVSLDLANTRVARMMVITSDDGLRGQLEKRYAENFAANVKELQKEK